MIKKYLTGFKSINKYLNKFQELSKKKQFLLVFSFTFFFLFTLQFTFTDWTSKVFNAATAVNGYLSTNTTAGITIAANAVTSLIGNGWLMGTNAIVNTNGNNYVAWAWKDDVTSGFQAVSYTGNGSNRTISHDLADTPDFMMIKRSDGVGDWVIYHKGFTTPTTQYLRFTAGTVVTDATVWNSTNPTGTNFSLGTNALVNTPGANYVAYVFAEKDGYSKFGSYVGNGSADGAFVYTGFKPRYALIKNTQVGGTNWRQVDAARSPIDPRSNHLAAQAPDAENFSDNGNVDFLSNGMKMRSVTTDQNTNGNLYIYAAFAESPFREQHTPNLFSIASSTRFNGTNAYLNRTAAASDRRTWTWSGWVKPSNPTRSTADMLFSSDNDPTTYDFMLLTNNSAFATPQASLRWTMFVSNTQVGSLQTNAAYRDPSKWMHVVFTLDTTNAVSSERMRMYVDGVRVTSFSVETYPPLNFEGRINSTNGQQIGFIPQWPGHYFNGYMADVNFVDGQALLPTSFGAFDANGLWKPINYSGTHGTNGFRLDFSNPSNPGNLTGAPITGLAFQPDLVWIKATSTSMKHALFDSLNGVGKYLSTGLTDAVVNSASSLTNFLSNGFGLGSDTVVNSSGVGYVAWNWKESPTSGFDIVTYTGNGTNRTIAHSLGATPGFMMIKRNDVAGDPFIAWFGSAANPANQYRGMDNGGNACQAPITDATMWNSTLPNSSTISLGTNANVNANGGSYTAYIFAEKEGYSKFGSYTGNGSSDGPFVYTGFKPRYLMVMANECRISDSLRNPFNPVNGNLWGNNFLAQTISSLHDHDYLSNGFKLRSSNLARNGSGTFYNYVAFAENPFREQHTPNLFSIASSTRFNGTNAYLSRGMTLSSNHTFSFWVKRGDLGREQSLFATTFFQINFNASDQLDLVGASFNPSTARYRDPSKWEHVVVSVTGTTAALYVNGKFVSSITDSNFGGGSTLSIGSNLGVNKFFNGYMADVNFVDGQALLPTSFGAFDANGLWKPINYSGTYGTNGFRLNFAQADAPGLDANAGSQTFQTGDRRSRITASTDLPLGGGSVSGMLDGDTIISGNGIWVSGSPVGRFIQFDFGAPKRVTGMNIYYQNEAVSPPNSVQFEGSNDAVSWTPIGGTFTMSWVTDQNITTMSGNTNYYRYYRVFIVSGTFEDNYINEFEFSEDSGNSFANINNNILTTDNVIDSPTNNFSTIQSVWKGNNVTLSQGSLRMISAINNNGDNQVESSIYFNSGKWYSEYTIDNSYAFSYIGLTRAGLNINGSVYVNQGQPTLELGTGTVYPSGPACPGATAGQTIMVAADLDTGNLWWGVNGTWCGSGNPASGLNPQRTGITGNQAFAISPYASTGFIVANFGQGGQAGLTYNAAAGGYFRYAPPTGFKALSTQNLTPTNTSLVKANNWFDVLGYTGNGGAGGTGFTPNNIAATDNVIDTPTNNFATLNPLKLSTAYPGSRQNGNLRFVNTDGVSSASGYSNIQTSQDKIYFETTIISGSSAGYPAVGMVRSHTSSIESGTWLPFMGGFAYDASDGQTYTNNSSTGFYSTAGTGDTIMVAYDSSTGQAWIGRNGTWFNSGNPAGGTGQIGTVTTGRLDLVPAFQTYASMNMEINFGQGGQSGLTYYPAAGGYFRYAPPSGFKALSTQNLTPTNPSLVKANNWFDVVLYTGNGVARTISSLNFEPGLLWIKDRTAANAHAIFGFGASLVSTLQHFFSEI